MFFGIKLRHPHCVVLINACNDDLNSLRQSGHSAITTRLPLINSPTLIILNPLDSLRFLNQYLLAHVLEQHF